MARKQSNSYSGGDCWNNVSPLLWMYMLLLLLLLSSSRNHGVVYGWRQCPLERGGGICPDHATCCAITNSPPGVSSCITGKKNEPLDQGDCCQVNDEDDKDSSSLTGCGFGFQCAVHNTTTTTSSSSSNNSNKKPYYCQRRDDAPDSVFPQNELKRYRLCSIPKDRHDILQDVYGFPIQGRDMTTITNTRTLQKTTTNDTSSSSSSSSSSLWQLAYYSNMKAITEPNDEHLEVETVWIVVHGSGRNADDYLCTAMASLPPSSTTTHPSNSKSFNSSTHGSILVIAPWFASPEDGPIQFANYHNHNNDGHDKDDDDTLLWYDPGPIVHTWRYGADSIQGGISSYETIDALIEYLSKAQIQFPKLKRIVVGGHSAGGQFVHRWALLSNSPVWGNNPHDDKEDEDEEEDVTTMVSAATSTPPSLRRRHPRQPYHHNQQEQHQQRSIALRAVVANPRSYCYLDHRRINVHNNHTLQSPDPALIAICPTYNTWQWGLDNGGILEPVPYKDRALIETPRSVLTYRYAKRNVVYLLGEYDILPLSDHCMTELFQGSTRRERGHNYVHALEQYFGYPVHVQLIASQSPHDHSLMFQSPQGQQALFEYSWSSSLSSSYQEHQHKNISRTTTTT